MEGDKQYLQAQAVLDEAIAYATQQRDDAYAAALARRDHRLQNPCEDEQYNNQAAEAYAAYYSPLEEAGSAWAEAAQEAYDAWRTALDAAEQAYSAAESQAWQAYLERLDQLNWQLEDSRQILEANFATARNRALHNWTEMESQAWDTYQRARGQMLQQPPEGERIGGPPALDLSTLLVMQVGGGVRRSEIPDKDLSRAVIKDCETEVKRRTPRDLHGRVVIEVARRTNRANPGAGPVREGTILNNDQALGRKWNDTVNKIRDTLTRAKYHNIQVNLRAEVTYKCTNHAGTARANALANLDSKIKYIIEVQATKGGANYVKTFEIDWNGIVIEQGVTGGSYPKPPDE